MNVTGNDQIDSDLLEMGFSRNTTSVLLLHATEKSRSVLHKRRFMKPSASVKWHR